MPSAKGPYLFPSFSMLMEAPCAVSASCERQLTPKMPRPVPCLSKAYVHVQSSLWSFR